MNDTTEVTYFQRLDLEKIKYDQEARLLTIKETAATDREREVTKRARIASRERLIRDLMPLMWAVLAVVTVFGAVLGIYAMATAGPPKTADQIQIEKKQERWRDCVYYNGKDKGAHDNVWYPTAEGGNGLCLPKDRPAPK